MTRKHSPARAVLSLSVLALLITGGLLYAGPLDPPAGPVASTYKTLTEVEPRVALAQAQVPITISQPGSYYLTSNLFAPVLVPAIITITVPGVTLDLSGFQVDCATDVGEATNGIKVNATATDCTIRNGSIIDATGIGIDCDAAGCTLMDLRVSGCIGGLSAARTVIIERCTATNNQFNGISIGTGGSGVVRGCVASDNGTNGFSVTGAVDGCVAIGNGQNGFIGLGTFTGCVSGSNGQNGFQVFNGTVSECRASSNQLSGISALNQVLVTRCNSEMNIGSGISLSVRCIALENSCSFNGFNAGDGAGIHTTGTDNRIEGNTCTFADRGIDVDVPGCIIIRNTCSGNTTNWVIAANNYYGPIIDRTGAATAAVNGSVAASTLTTTDPHANFSY